MRIDFLKPPQVIFLYPQWRDKWEEERQRGNKMAFTSFVYSLHACERFYRYRHLKSWYDVHMIAENSTCRG